MTSLVTSFLIQKKLISKPVLPIKGGNCQHSRCNTPERASSELSENHPRFPNRPPWAELRRAQNRQFSRFKTENGMTTCRQTIPFDGFSDHKYVLWHSIFTLEWTENSSAVRTTSYGARKIAVFQKFLVELVWRTVNIQYHLTTSPATYRFITAPIWCYWQREIWVTFVAWSRARAKWPIFKLCST